MRVINVAVRLIFQPLYSLTKSLLITLHRFVRVAAGVVGGLSSVVGYDNSRENKASPSETDMKSVTLERV